MAQPVPVQAGRPAPTGAATFLAIFSLPFCGVGLWMVAMAFLAAGQGELEGQELLLQVVFALVFGGAGLAMLLASRALRRRIEERHALRTGHPEEPWRWRTEWATGRVPAAERQHTAAICAFAVLWNLILLPFYLGMPGQVEAALFLVPFVLVGIGLAVWAGRVLLARRKFGASVFQMETLPGVLGGPLRGAVHVPRMLRPEAGFTLTLACLNRVTTGSGKNRSTQEHVRWQEEKLVPATSALAAPQGTALPVRFEIPHDLPASDPEESDDQWVWRLAARADVPGVDYAASFEIPVFRTGESRSDAVAAAAEPAPEIGATPTPVMEAGRVTAVRLPDGGVELWFPMARSPGAAVAFTIFALVWNAFVLVMGSQAPWPVWLFLSIFLLVGAFLGFAALDLWFGTVRIRARRNALETTRRCLGIGRKRVYGPGEIADFRVEKSGHIGKTTLFALKAQRADRKWRSTLADGLTDRRLAERILALLKEGFEGEAP